MKNNPLIKHVRKDIPGIFNEIEILKKHKNRLKHALAHDVVLPPYEVIIHPSAICNLHCQWCIGGKILEEKKANKVCNTLPNSLAKPENMEKVIMNLINYRKKGFRIENVSFSGITGEPFMAKASFIKAVDLLTKNNIRVGVFSNTTILDDDLIKSLLKINYINVSLDAGTAKTYATLKYAGKSAGKKMFRDLIKNLKKLTKARKESKISILDINASFVLYPTNYKEIYKTAVMLKKIGIKTMRMKQDISNKMMLTSKQKTKADLLINKIKKIEDDNFKFIAVHRINTPSDMKRDFKKCFISDLFAAIGSDGNVYPCNYQACFGSPNYGNVIKNDFQEIWEGQAKMSIRNKLPKICPTKCDPFKNRANRLLQTIKDAQDKYGAKKTEAFIKEITHLY